MSSSTITEASAAAAPSAHAVNWLVVDSPEAVHPLGSTATGEVTDTVAQPDGSFLKTDEIYDFGASVADPAKGMEASGGSDDPSRQQVVHLDDGFRVARLLNPPDTEFRTGP